MPLAFIDTNIFMYAIGGDHANKEPSQNIVDQLVENRIEGAINVEVLQEVLYRYSAIGRPKVGYELFDTLVHTFSIIWPIEKGDLTEARRLQERHGVKTRDAIHAATMKRNGVNTLYSFDRDFDRVPGLQRIQKFL